MFGFIKRYIGARLGSLYFIDDDPDKIEVDVVQIMSDDKLIVDLNIVVLAYVVIADFSPEIAIFIHAMRGLNLTAQQLSVVMIRSGSAFQFLSDHKDIAIEKAKQADFRDFSDVIIGKINEVIKRYDNLKNGDEDAPNDDPINKKALSQDELANKLIDEYLKNNKKRRKNKQDNDN